MLSIKYQIKPETLRQTAISLPHLLHTLLLSPLRVHGTPVLPSLEDWQALARAWLTACWCFISYHTHSMQCTGLGVSDSPCGSALQAAQHHTYKSQRCEKAHFGFAFVKSDPTPKQVGNTVCLGITFNKLRHLCCDGLLKSLEANMDRTVWPKWQL